MKELIAVLLLVSSSVASAGDNTFIIPARLLADGTKSADVTICSTKAIAEHPQATDVLSTFPMNKSGRPIAHVMRDNAMAIVENVRVGLEANPKLADDPEWNPDWLTPEHWQTVEKCGLGHNERAPAAK